MIIVLCVSLLTHIMVSAIVLTFLHLNCMRIILTIAKVNIHSNLRNSFIRHSHLVLQLLVTGKFTSAINKMASNNFKPCIEYFLHARLLINLIFKVSD